MLVISPAKILLPTNTEENTAGNLPNIETATILPLLIGSKLAQYVIKSFGSAGKKYNINNVT